MENYYIHRVPFFLQDLADKPQYTLVLQTGTSSVSYFSEADPNSNREAAVIWWVLPY